jgi:hypothetical protein
MDSRIPAPPRGAHLVGVTGMPYMGAYRYTTHTRVVWLQSYTGIYHLGMGSLWCLSARTEHEQADRDNACDEWPAWLPFRRYRRCRLGVGCILGHDVSS